MNWTFVLSLEEGIAGGRSAQLEVALLVFWLAVLENVFFLIYLLDTAMLSSTS